MAFASVINGTSGNDILFGGTGNDLLTGGTGTDLFVISKGYGSDTLADFQAGAGGDVLRLQNYGFATLASFLAAASQVGSDTVVTLSASETLTLQNVARSSLTAANVALDNPLLASGPTNTAAVTVQAGGTLTTGQMNDSLQAMGTDVTLIGGAGDDTYFMYNHSTKVVELAGEGIDTVVSGMIDGYSLVNAPNVENLKLGDIYSSPATGNDLDNIITGNAGNNVIDGGRGNDVLVGAAGSDTFVIAAGNGNDIITDFKAGVGGDILQLNNTGFKTFADVTAAAKQVGTDLVLTIGSGETIRLENTNLQNITAANVNIVSHSTGLIQTFNDDFIALSAGQDPSLAWRTSYAWSGAASYSLANEQQIYVDPSFSGLPGTQAARSLGLNPFSIQDGQLVITAQPLPADVAPYVGNHQFSSGMISTENSFVQTYGYFEMTATLPDTKGAWPAFWMLPIDTHGLNTELDVVEALGRDPDQAHWGFLSATTPNQGYWANTADLTTGKHTFAVEWTPYTLTYLVDGKEVGQVATPSDMNTAMYMIANLAMGGSWAGSPALDATAKMTIDSITAYQLPEYTLANYTLLASGATTNTIAGTAGADTLTGTSGNDLLGDAGGTDTMTGGAGDDTYIVSDSNSKVVEGYGGGIDTIKSSVSYALYGYVENLTLTGSAVADASGNSLSNIVTGNSAANVITGGYGNDILTGGDGSDTFVIKSGDGSDIITDFSSGSGAGHDVVKLNGFAFTSFNDIQAAMTQVGNDVYLALTSQDTLVFRNTTVSALTSDNFQLPATLPVGGTITSWISGTAASRMVYGTAANDKITAVNYNDTLIGWTGDDTYVVGNSNENIVENAHSGIDSVEAWSSYTLSANVENLTLAKGGLTGTGNQLVNRIVGSSGDDVIDGGGGNDWISGGTGNDTFIYKPGSGNVTIADFHAPTSTSSEQDKLVLKGYDAGAYLTNVGDVWTVHYAGGTDTLRIVGVSQLLPTDYAFVSASNASMSMAVLAAPTISLASGSGPAGTGLTNTNHPTLTGYAQAGVTVKVFDGSTQIGTAVADNIGAWSLTTATLADGSHAFTAVATDGIGRLSVASAPVDITIDTVAPAAPNITSFSPDNDVVGDGITSADHVALTGTAEAGSAVSMFDGATQIGTAITSADGAWSFATGTLTGGSHSFTGRAVDAAGNLSAASTALNVTIGAAAPTLSMTVIEASGSTSLVELGDYYYLYGSSETGPTLKSGGSPVLASQRAGIAAALGAEQTTTGYTVVWKLDASNYSIWTTDRSGNNLSYQHVSGTNDALQRLETSFDQDLNGDGVKGLVAAPAATVIEASGLTSLVQLNDNYYLYGSGGSGPTLKVGGSPVLASQRTGIAVALGAEQTTTGYTIVWKLDANNYSIWTTDRSGNNLSYAHVSGTSAALLKLEISFDQDLNGDGVKGLVAAPAATVIEASGSTSLVQLNDNYHLYGSSGSGPVLQYMGTPVSAAERAGLAAPLGAEQTTTGYTVVWKLGANDYSIWNADFSGNGLSYTHVSGTGAALLKLETTFDQDLNGDGMKSIAAATMVAAPLPTVIEASGSTSLVQLNDNYYLYGSTGSGPVLKYMGAPVAATERAGLAAPLGAEQTTTGYTVVWKLGANDYSIWNTDLSGNELSYVHVSGTNDTLKSLETNYLQDLNGDGVINTASTVLEISGKVSLALANMSQAVTIDTGATLELTGAVSGSVTFNGPTGTLVLDHASQFTGTLIHLTGDGSASNSNQIDVKDIAYGAGTLASYSGNEVGGVLAVTDAQGHAAHISLLGDYTHSTFNLSDDGSGGTLVIDPPEDQFHFAPVSTPQAAPAEHSWADGLSDTTGLPIPLNSLTTVLDSAGYPEPVHLAMPTDAHLADFDNFLLR